MTARHTPPSVTALLPGRQANHRLPMERWPVHPGQPRPPEAHERIGAPCPENAAVRAKTAASPRKPAGASRPQEEDQPAARGIRRIPVIANSAIVVAVVGTLLAFGLPKVFNSPSKSAPGPSPQIEVDAVRVENDNGVGPGDCAAPEQGQSDSRHQVGAVRGAAGRGPPDLPVPGSAVIQRHLPGNRATRPAARPDPERADHLARTIRLRRQVLLPARAAGWSNRGHLGL